MREHRILMAASFAVLIGLSGCARFMDLDEAPITTCNRQAIGSALQETLFLGKDRRVLRYIDWKRFTSECSGEQAGKQRIGGLAYPKYSIAVTIVYRISPAEGICFRREYETESANRLAATCLK